MPNIVRNDLTIEGENLTDLLQAIGFKTYLPRYDVTVLIDFERIVPPPSDEPEGGWRKWHSDNWGTFPYDGYRDGDIFELTERKVSFKFYTRWTGPYELVKALAERYSTYKINLRSCEQPNFLTGEATWENGELTLFRPMMRLRVNDSYVPANDPVTNEDKATAEKLVLAAVPEGMTTIPENAVAYVADVIAHNVADVHVQFERNATGNFCLVITDKQRPR